MSDDNSNSTFELNRRRALAGLGTIGVASAGAGAGTMALFSDTEESSGNTVQAGTLDLDIGDDTTSLGDADGDGDEDFGAKGSASFAVDSLAPGESSARKQITVANEGSIKAGTLQWTYDVTTYDGDNPGSETGSVDNIDEHIQVQIWYGTTGGGANEVEVTQAVDNNYGDGNEPLYLSELGGETVKSTPGMDPYIVRGIDHKFTLDSSTDNRYQGDYAEIDLTFELLQE